MSGRSTRGVSRGINRRRACEPPYRLRTAGLAALLAGAVYGLLAVPAAGQARLIRGPYVQEASPASISVLWQTDRPTAPLVEYRPEDPPADVGWYSVGSGQPGRSHVITLAGLDPATRYQYRVHADGETIYEGTFRTWPTPDADALDFVVYGDNRTNHGPHGDVVRAILREPVPPALLLHTGDLVENGGRLEQWEIFFRLERDLLARVPLYPALGNHEDDSPLYFEAFRLPSNGTAQGYERWYSVDVGPAHFVALDVVFSDFGPGSPQYRWLEQDLARTDRPWKFVYFHYPPYNASVPHGSNLGVRAALERLFLQYGVSLIFTGHAHIYERAEGSGLPALPYIISGGGGAPLHQVGLQPWTRYTEASYHFLRVTLRGDEISTTGVRADGTEFDPFVARLSADGRLEAVSALAAPVAVPGPTVLDFLGSFHARLLLGYAAFLAVVTPLGVTALLPRRRARIVPVPSGREPLPRGAPAHPHQHWRGMPVLGLFGAVAGLLGLAFVLDAPLHWLIGFDFYSIGLTFHAVGGVGLTLIAVIAAGLGYRLATGPAPALQWLKWFSLTAAALAAMSALGGSVLYARYLTSGGPMEQLIRKAPEAHRVLFEFKEYVGLVPLPLAVAAAFIIWRYGEGLRRDRYLAETLALLLLLLGLYCLLPLGLGASVTRLRGIL